MPIYLDGRELTDDDILYYIDEDYYTIVELERVTKAPKNLIRNGSVNSFAQIGLQALV